MRDIKDKAILYAFNKERLVVYSQILDLDAYYDGGHILDSGERLKAIGIVRLVGTLFDREGNLFQEFENTYDESTGCLIGSKASHEKQHLEANERFQKSLAIFTRLQEQRDVPRA